MSEDISKDVIPEATGEPEATVTSETTIGVQQKTALDFIDSPEVKAAIDAAVEKRTSGLLKNRDDILAEKKALDDQLKNIDLDEYSSLKKSATDAEEEKLKAAGNFDELLEIKSSEIRNQYEAKLSDANRKVEEANQINTDFQSQLKNRTISDTIRELAVKDGVQPQALDDVVAKATKEFVVNQSMELESRDANGDLVKDANGYIVSPEIFLKNLKVTNSYYWGSSTPSGLEGSNSNSSNKPNISEQMANAVNSNDMVAYRRLRAKSLTS